MTALILDGRALAKEIESDVENQVKTQRIYPHLAVCIVGNDAASNIYVRNKQLACSRVGMKSTLSRLSATTTINDISELISDWNQNPDIHGILLQLPLPERVHPDRMHVLNLIDPRKDVDGFQALNVGKVTQGVSGFIPCTPCGIIRLLSHYKIDLCGKHVVIINDTLTIGRPLSMMVLERGGTVTICNKLTPDVKYLSRQADVLVTAVGRRPHFVVTKDMIRMGAVVVDVGISRLEGKIAGDVDFDEVSAIASHISPVPGGCGPLTVSCLLENTFMACQNRFK